MVDGLYRHLCPLPSALCPDMIQPVVLDTLNRPLRTLRVSVTDRCNLRCHYCMPEEDYVWLPREDLLTFEEIVASRGFLRGAWCGSAADHRWRAAAAPQPSRTDRTARRAAVASRPLADDQRRAARHRPRTSSAGAGLHRLTVSLDTLRADRFHRLRAWTRCPMSSPGIEAARRAGFTGLKLDAVITRGDNDDELVDLVDFAREVGAEIRFIEYMDVGGATEWRPDAVVSEDEMLARLTGALSARSTRSPSRARQRPRRGSGCRAVRSSASSRRRRSRSAARAIARA